MHLFLSYIKFYFRSVKLHGVHSPFVFELITKCFKDKTPYPEYKILNKYNLQLSRSNETITITDFGKGSRVFKNNTRKISDIAKHAGISKKRQRLLFRLANYFNLKNTLELGSSLGKATIALALNKNNRVISIEGCSATAEYAEKTLKQAGCENATIINETFETFLSKPLDTKPDCIYIDGNHSYRDTIFSFHQLLPYVHNETVMIFDDIYWSKEMTLAWKEITAHPQVTIAIDTFYWGMVFFRKEQQKESFTVRL